MHCERIQTPDALRQNYWLLDEACERLTAREDRSHFAPDVYAAVMRGDAMMTLVVDKTPVGFMVTYPDTSPDKRDALRVWIAYVRPGVSPEALETGFQEAQLLAAEQGLPVVMFSTQRRGWLRSAKRLGYELGEFTYFKEVRL